MRELFRDKTYLITGATAGIGKEFALELHRRGADLILTGRREERLATLSEELNATRSGSVEYVVADLGSSDEGGIQKLVEISKERDIYGLINNAGYGSFGRYQELDIEGECQMFRVNVEAPLRLTHSVLPQMLERKDGVIINLASIAAFQPLPYMATYAATKAANFSYSLSQHYELKKSGIRVLAVCPGPIPTEFAEVAKVPGSFGSSSGDSVQDVVGAALRGIERGSLFVVPGIWGKFFSYATRFTPRFLNMTLSELVLRSRL